jgi:hypothetical protein
MTWRGRTCSTASARFGFPRARSRSGAGKEGLGVKVGGRWIAAPSFHWGSTLALVADCSMLSAKQDLARCPRDQRAQSATPSASRRSRSVRNSKPTDAPRSQRERTQPPSPSGGGVVGRGLKPYPLAKGRKLRKRPPRVGGPDTTENLQRGQRPWPVNGVQVRCLRACPTRRS